MVLREHSEPVQAIPKENTSSVLNRKPALEEESKMKAFHLAVVLLIVCISSAMALKCNRCVPYTAGGRCTNTVETCQRTDEVCAYVINTFPKYSYFKRCMRRADAFALQSVSSFQVFTCTTDLCN